MNQHPRRGHGRLQALSERSALALLLLAVGFVSGFGAPSAPSAERVAAPAAVAGPAAESSSAVAEVASPVVVEYAPVSIDSLPVHRASADPESWGTAPSLTLVTRGSIAPGQSLSASLQRQGISPATVDLIAREIRPVFDFRHSHPGDRYRLGQDPAGRLLDFRYFTSPEKNYYLFWEGTRYVVREERAELRSQLAKVAGTVDSSLYDAIRALGEQAQLASDFADIFAWDIDFSRNVRPGDDFQILYERMYRTDDDGEQVYVKPGRILAARYRGAVGDHAVVYFESEDGRGSYYRPDGTSVERAFLVAPLEFRRITSTYTNARLHPILNVVRPHHGIDYAAARGTPLWSVAEGTVIFRGWAGASGNLVKIRHANGYVSYYAHLSRIEQGLRVGQRISQKQVIGYVGDSGLATGPHVCFRVQKNGRYVNPLEIASPAGGSISSDDWNGFKARRDLLLSDLGESTLVAADEAL